MNKKLIVSAALFLSLFCVSAAVADNERFLGATRLSFRENDLDAINVTTCPKPAYTSIQLRSKFGAIGIKSLYVKYGNGQTERLRVAENIRQGGNTRWIDLNGNRRCLKQIAILGDTNNAATRQARVEFWGKY